MKTANLILKVLLVILLWPIVLGSSGLTMLSDELETTEYSYVIGLSIIVTCAATVASGLAWWVSLGWLVLNLL